MSPPGRHARRAAVVVGAGVFGAAAALELRRRGWAVDLLERGPVPHPRASSTDVSKIVRADYGDDRFFTDLAERALDGWERWNASWEPPPYHATGFLVLRGGPLEPGTFEGDSLRTLEERGWPLERLDAAGVRRHFPAWNAERFPHGYLNPRAGWAESGRVVAGLVDRGRREGVRVRPGTGVEGLLEEGSKVAGVRLADGGVLRADRVVVAAGAWTPALLPWLSDRLRTVGQPVLHLAPADPSPWRPPHFPVWAADISRTGWYGFPALPDGRVKVGHHGAGTRVDPDGPDRVADDHVERCRDFLADALPALADAPVVGRRLCLYCDAFDGAFLVGGDPGREGLVVAAGGSGHGFKFAPLLGPLVADAVEGRQGPEAERIGWRPAGRGARESARHEG